MSSKISRNSLCSCGSNKKFKKCCIKKTYIADEVGPVDLVQLGFRTAIEKMNKLKNGDKPHCLICGDIDKLVGVNFTNGKKVNMCSFCFDVQSKMK